MDDLIRAYLIVNEQEEVVEAIWGNAIIPKKPYDFFFIYSKEIAGDDDLLTIEKCQRWQDATFGGEN